MRLLQKAIVVCLVTTFTGIFSIQATKATEVNFPDANLETKVRDHLGITAPTPITDADMATMTGEFDAYKSNISNLQGIEHATNLTSLSLSYNYSISDLSPVSGLTNLTELYLYKNSISDISTISGMTNLTSLSLGCNNINDISALSGLTKLTFLELASNSLSDISVVSGMTDLTNLSLGDNNISDISAISGLTKLTRLSLYSDPISDTSALSELTNLTWLNLEATNTSDISVLSGMTQMVDLRLSSNNISDLSPLSQMTDLEDLSIGNNSISDISALSDLTKLRSLYIYQNSIKDVSAVSGLENLQQLRLSDNQIECMDLSSANLTKLFSFNINNNPLTEVLLVNTVLDQDTFDVLMDGSSYTGIAELSGVLKLDMSGVDFTDISDLSALCTADDLEKLSFANASNLDGSTLVTLTNELDSLHVLNVTGLWSSFDETEKDSLLAWDAIEGNTLITQFGDANRDNVVDHEDALLLSQNWQYGVADGQTASWGMGDFNGDGQVDGSDATILAANWQEETDSCTTAVPEPATLSLLLTLIGVAMLWKKRRGIN